MATPSDCSTSSLTDLEFHQPHIFPSLPATSSNQQNIVHLWANSSHTPLGPTMSSSHRTFNHHSKIHFLFVSPLSHLFLCFTQSPLFLYFLGPIFNPLNLGAPIFSCRPCGAFFCMKSVFSEKETHQIQHIIYVVKGCWRSLSTHFIPCLSLIMAWI